MGERAQGAYNEIGVYVIKLKALFSIFQVISECQRKSDIRRTVTGRREPADVESLHFHKINYNMKRANLFTVTATAKIKGIKDRRNIRPLAEIKERIAYDPATGSFTYRVDCDAGNAGEDAVWRCRRTDNVGTSYVSTRYWELVKFAADHWYDPRKLAYYFVTGAWPPIDTWVAGGEKFDYSAETLRLVASGEMPPRAKTPELSESNTAPPSAEMRSEQPKKGLLARLFGL